MKESQKLYEEEIVHRLLKVLIYFASIKKMLKKQVIHKSKYNKRKLKKKLSSLIPEG